MYLNSESFEVKAIKESLWTELHHKYENQNKKNLCIKIVRILFNCFSDVNNEIYNCSN